MPGDWRIRISDEAERDLERLPRRVRLEAVDLIDSLREDPFQHNAEELRRNEKVFRVYLAGKQYRLIYRVNSHKREVLVGRVRLRGEAYKGLRNP